MMLHVKNGSQQIRNTPVKVKQISSMYKQKGEKEIEDDNLSIRDILTKFDNISKSHGTDRFVNIHRIKYQRTEKIKQLITIYIIYHY